MLSQRARYALKALLRLSRGKDAAVGVAVIARDEQIPAKYLEAIMADLRRAGLVESTRGRSGGYRLARPAHAISFGEVIRLTDGPIALISCASRNFYRRCEDCPDQAACALHAVMAGVRDEMSAILDRRTLADAAFILGERFDRR